MSALPTSTALDLLRDVTTYVFDYDGTLVRGTVPIAGAVETIRRLQDAGRRVGVVTNNSYLDSAELSQRLERQGFVISPAAVHTAVSASADAALSRAGRGRVLCAGSAGLERALRERGLHVVSEDPDVVVAGMDRALSFERLSNAVRAVLSGAYFIGVNLDRLFIDTDQLGPGGGVLVTAIAYAAGREPDLIVGKPSGVLLASALRGLNSESTTSCMVGDNPETDMSAARAVGMLALLVRTGVATTRTGQRTAAAAPPDLEIDSVADLPAAAGLIF